MIRSPALPQVVNGHLRELLPCGAVRVPQGRAKSLYDITLIPTLKRVNLRERLLSGSRINP